MKKNTFLQINRIFLLAGLILSFIIPFLKFQWISVPNEITYINLPEIVEPEVFLNQHQPVHSPMIDYFTIITWIYISGSLFLFLKLLFSIQKLLRLKKDAEILDIGKFKIIKTTINQPFSFFHWIFLPKNGSHQLIISHEMAHIRQCHAIDLILMEFTYLMLWFNPFVVLYKKTLKLQHEYLADNEVTANELLLPEYLYCMYKQAKVASFSGFIHPFFSNQIKKRIHMMTKNKTKFRYLIVYSLIFPLVAVLLLAFTNINKKEYSSSKENVPSMYPIDIKKVTQVNGYGEWTNPFTKKKEMHLGVDFAMQKGENVMATAKGIVVEATFDTLQKKGNYVVIKHNDKYSTFYSHLSEILIKKGDEIEKGQIIGFVGNTGVSTGPHLHYEVIENGERINPAAFLPK